MPMDLSYTPEVAAATAPLYPRLKHVAPDVLEEADFVGSTAGMIRDVAVSKPAQVVLITECSMSDNVAVAHPDVECVRPCALCPHMKRITLRGILRSLESMEHEVEVPPSVAERAPRAVERMFEPRAIRP